MTSCTGNSDSAAGPIVFQTGFRIFFLGASVHAALATIVWMALYTFGVPTKSQLPAQAWHAHEMIYGFATAVIAGFLLTAVTNWTKRPTLSGKPLAGLFCCWALARMLHLCPGPVALASAAGLDTIFLVGIFAGITRPIVASRQLRQAPIVISLALLIAGHTFFYLGAYGIMQDGLRLGTYLGLYMVLNLILTVGRRVVPFFTSRGTSPPSTLRNHPIIDTLCTGIYVLFVFGDLFAPTHPLVPISAAALAIVHAIRLQGWWTPAILQKPLLWVLHLGWSFIILGFCLKVLSHTHGLLPYYGLHAFSYGGVGIFCLGMIARVSLGHSGRNVDVLPKGAILMFPILIAGAIIRIVAPIVDVAHYRLWMGLSQVAWIAAFSLLTCLYWMIWISPRADGQPG